MVRCVSVKFKQRWEIISILFDVFLSFLRAFKFMLSLSSIFQIFLSRDYALEGKMCFTATPSCQE